MQLKNKMERKEVIKEMYDIYALEYESSRKDFLKKFILEDAKLFVSSLSGKDVLDLGCGPGRDSLFLKGVGLNVICIDISPAMVELCREKGLDARVSDLENLDFSDGSFDGVWAYTSLLHSPKVVFKNVIAKIKDILRDKGVFYLGMKEGNSEGEYFDGRYGGTSSFVSFYSDEELRKILSSSFEIIHPSRVEFPDKAYLNYLCRKRLFC